MFYLVRITFQICKCYFLFFCYIIFMLKFRCTSFLCNGDRIMWNKHEVFYTLLFYFDVQYLTHYQTTNFRLFQTQRVCRRQFQIWWKWQKVIQTGRKHCGKRRNCLLRAISPFPTVFSKGSFPGGVKSCHSVGMGYTSATQSRTLTRGPWGPESLYRHWLAGNFNMKESPYKT